MYRSVLLAFLAVLQLSLVVGDGPEACAQPGALRCDGDHQSVCLARSGVWLRTSDCAASGRACVDGQCVPTADSPDERAEVCKYPTDKTRCSANCGAVEICISSGVWSTLQTCSGTETCDLKTVECAHSNAAACGEVTNCYIEGNFPYLRDSRVYYVCSGTGHAGERRVCDGTFFNACTGECDYDEDPMDRYPTPCTTSNSGYSSFIFSNPGLYYVCADGEPVWIKCATGYYEEAAGHCIGTSSYCTNCTTEPVTTPSPPDSFECEEGDLFEDPSDTCLYYRCLEDGTLEHRKCPPNYIFNNVYGGCVFSENSCL